MLVQDGRGSGPDLAATAESIIVRVDGVNVGGSTVHDGLESITFTPFDELDLG